jgi:hypothetical protein
MSEGVVLAVVLDVVTIDVVLHHKLTDRLTIRLVYHAKIILNGYCPILKQVSMIGAEAQHVGFVVGPQVRLL